MKSLKVRGLTVKIDKAFIDTAAEVARRRLSIQIDAIRADRSVSKEQREQIIATLTKQRQAEVKSARQEAMQQEQGRVHSERTIDKYKALRDPAAMIEASDRHNGQANRAKSKGPALG